ncbi:MarR family transcriptional regulator [Alkalihalobacillus sp. MEB130]|uniref:MarR family winged helix-turn-helix transcriptional regulator n=1 Tax=Alkalihalobacillus sp. MEB130 TaxID=2976704 RepID=UPI0028DEFE61|nr:MarR family transcriptional regulator [Alkalihalobacillus sp. MEB130]MDT8860650.1 MarR family transcriptional regulator [Alkalihalobacillus sp. MEB130]
MERDLENRVGYQIGVVAHLMHNQLNQKLADYGVTHAQFKVLYQLKEHQELVQSNLQNRLYIKASTMNGIIESMLKNELIIKKDSEKDRRSKVITLTTKGEQLEEKLWNEIGKMDTELTQIFSDEEKRSFVSYLRRIVQSYGKQ